MNEPGLFLSSPGRLEAAIRALQYILTRFVEEREEVEAACIWHQAQSPVVSTGPFGSMPDRSPPQPMMLARGEPSPWASMVSVSGTPRGVVAPLLWQGEPAGTLFLAGTRELNLVEPRDLQAVGAASFALIQMRALLREKPQPHNGDHDSFYTVGKLASGVAPELNNLLTEVLGYAQLLSAAPDQEQGSKAIGFILNCALRAKTLTQPLTTFGQHSPALYETVSPSRLIDNALVLVRNSMEQARIRLVSRVPELPSVFGDPAQLLQTLVNILLNAQQSIGSGGIITIHSKAVDASIEIMVEDSGNSSTARPTTQVVSPECEFGLDAARTVIHDHGGGLTVSGNVNSGRRILIRLPAVANQAADPNLGNAPECILVLERDREQRELIETVLNGMGQREVVAVHPGDARDHLARRTVSLAILDALPEPGMPTPYTALRARGTNLPIIFAVTREHMETSASLADPWSFLLNKPFRKRDMAALVARLLDLSAQAAA